MSKISRKAINDLTDNEGAGGAPRDRAPHALITAIGPPPSDPIQAAQWDSHLLRASLYHYLHGEVSAHMLTMIRQSVANLATATPVAAQMAAATVLDRADATIKQAKTGPELEELDGVEVGQVSIR